MERLVTMFGGGGFLGRYVAQALFRTGVRVRIAQTNPGKAYTLKPLAGVGQIQFARVDIRDRDRVREAVRGSSAVINLVGVLSGDFKGLHVDGARNIAEAAAATGAESLVHVSAIGADPASASAYGRSKGDGEAAVRAGFADAAILRPSILFGREDHFINRFATMMRVAPIVPVIAPRAKFQPIYVGDVADAVVAALSGDAAGKTYELGGPQVLTMGELLRWIADATGRSPLFVDVPDVVASALASGLGWAPGAPITKDQWLMLQHDNVVAPGASGLADLGVSATPLAAVTEGWLSAYRRNGRFAAKSPY